MHRSSLLALLGTARVALAGYSLADDYLSGDFFGQWDFFTDADPTLGYVNYVDQSTAKSNGYIKKNDDGSIYLGVDHTNVASGRGRDSVRLSSQKTYTHYLTVIDVGHMPGGICGTWPAFWSFGNAGGWPNSGEIDIIEGANDQQANIMSLHTSPGCENSASNSLVAPLTNNCDANANANQGCTFHDSSSNTYGSQFNAQGGGTYAAEWTSDGISIWFWPSGGAPADALGDNPDPSGWGNPRASWGGSGCDWDSKFQAHNLVFDTTFCGSWAGNAFQSCSAANNGQTCTDFVKNNPTAFEDAYWQVKALKVYQQGGSGSSPKSSTTASSPSLSVTIPVPTSTFATSSTSLIGQSSDSLVTSGTSSSAAASSSATLLQEGSGGVFIPQNTASADESTSSAAQPTSSVTDSTPSATSTVPTSTVPTSTVPTTTASASTVQDESGGIFIPKHTESADSSVPSTSVSSTSGHRKSKHHKSKHHKSTATASAAATSTECSEESSKPTNKVVPEEETAEGDVYRPGTWYALGRRVIRL